MRVLITSIPEPTHVLKLVPLAWALRAAGHEVRIASLPRLTTLVEEAGLTAVPVGRDVEVNRAISADEREEHRRGLPPPYHIAEHGPDDSRWAEDLEAYRLFVRWEFQLQNQPLVGGLVDFCRQWRPDLVLWEPNTYAGPIAARACGARHGRVLFTTDVYGVTHQHFRQRLRTRPDGASDPLADWLGGYCRRYGLDFAEDLVHGEFTVDQSPPSLRLRAPGVDYLPMQYVPYGGRAAVPAWLWQRPSRPRVALTLGLSATEHFGGYTFAVGEVLDALADLDVEIVATVAGATAAGPVPANVRLTGFAPLHALAPTCAVVVNHGGFGTVSTVARYGVPQLVLPYHFEGPLLAGRLAARGAAVVLGPDDVGGAAVRRQVARLLDEEGFRAGAAALRDEILAQPTPAGVVPRLEERVRG
ncbi:activator-dependent family glycosyltransferase [Micromonospora sp. WMMD975]|uniref:activator-dependent family glycosyltransferase n=1 Tax=Micromonospora sp. WMMD975 TaxID=3016087 RepID=UPI00249BA29E|nr:activator-dependent family glycosyltransferase [Micromonospora sp. WMMD975]WFE36462.1 activator-dependent family glycosyltransferase [Micromonospora sp. WMMD975]